MNVNKNNYYKDSQLEKIITDICRYKYKYFFNKKGVVGVALGYKVKDSFYTYQKCIQVFVMKKLPSYRLYYNDMIPVEFNGIPTDVIETGVFTASSLIKKIRPIEGGYSIGCLGSYVSGSVGCLVSNGVSNFILSTNHVLAEGNTKPLQTPIVQPSIIYGSRSTKNIFATLYKYVPLRFIEGTHEPINFTDAALGLLTKSNILSPKIALIGKVNCVKNARLNEPVKKVGAETELTQGTVTSVNSTLRLNYSSIGKSCIFHDVILTTLMSENGDSGSILVNRSNCAVGMLFARGTNTSVYCNLKTVLDQLGVYIVT